jgi:hypothetical protein
MAEEPSQSPIRHRVCDQADGVPSGPLLGRRWLRYVRELLPIRAASMDCAERTSGGRLRVEPLNHAHALESEG